MALLLTRLPCSEGQYKRQFSLWKLKKNIPTPTTTAIYGKLHNRAQLGGSSSVTWKGQDVDPGKMHRLVRTKRRQEIKLDILIGVGFADIEALSGHALQCGTGCKLYSWSDYLLLTILQLHELEHATHYFTHPKSKSIRSCLIIRICRANS